MQTSVDSLDHEIKESRADNANQIVKLNEDLKRLKVDYNQALDDNYTLTPEMCTLTTVKGKFETELASYIENSVLD